MHQGDLKCVRKDQKYGLDTSEALENIRSFCPAKKGSKITEDNDIWVRDFQTSGAVLNTLRVKWTNDSPGCGGGGALFKNGYTIDEVRSIAS